MKTYLLILLILVAGCSREKMQESGRSTPASNPTQAARHYVELYKVQIAAEDFALSAQGNVQDIRVLLLEDGRALPTRDDYNIVSGERGKRKLSHPLAWDVNYTPQKTYQIDVQEQGVTDMRHYVIPTSPRAGYWPIGENKGHLAFGSDSWLEFRDKIEE